MNLNIYYDADESIWQQLPSIYAQLEGQLGYKEGIPYWFNFDDSQKHIVASIESSGLNFQGLMEDDEWNEWVRHIKVIATQVLECKVGEFELGEVEDWIVTMGR